MALHRAAEGGALQAAREQARERARASTHARTHRGQCAFAFGACAMGDGACRAPSRDDRATLAMCVRRRWQVELGSLLYGCCISWRMQDAREDAVSAPEGARDNATECDALEGRAYRLVLSGAASHLVTYVWPRAEPAPGDPVGGSLGDGGSGGRDGGAGSARAPDDAPVVAVRIDEAQGWTDVSTGERVGRQHLQRVLASLDALLLRPRAAAPAVARRPGLAGATSGDMPPPPSARVILRQFALSQCSARGGDVRSGGDSVHAAASPASIAAPAPAGSSPVVAGPAAATPSLSSRPAAAPLSPAAAKDGLEGCDELYAGRRWHDAQDCYSTLLPHLPGSLSGAPAGRAGRRVSDRTVEEWSHKWGAERVCWSVLRAARVRLMLSKERLSQSLASLDTAAAAAALVHAHEAGGGGSRHAAAAGWAGLGQAVGVGTCAGWVERTRGDLLFRNKQYDAAKRAYLAALRCLLHQSAPPQEHAAARARAHACACVHT